MVEPTEGGEGLGEMVEEESQDGMDEGRIGTGSRGRMQLQNTGDGNRKCVILMHRTEWVIFHVDSFIYFIDFFIFCLTYIKYDHVNGQRLPQRALLFASTSFFFSVCVT